MYQFIYSHGQYVSILTPTHARAYPQYGQHLGLTLYVKAYIGNDRTDTEKYLDLYQKKVFRLTLEGE